MNDEQKIPEEKKVEDNSFHKLVNIAVVIMLVALVFIALFTFFFSMQDAISALFDVRYSALIRAIFSLVVIGVGVYLIKMYLSEGGLR